MALTPADVHNVAFSRPRIGKRGYSEQEVDLFIDLVEQELIRHLEEEGDLRNRNAELRNRDGGLQKREALLREREAELRERESTLNQHESQVQKHEKQLRQHEGQLAQRASQLAQQPTPLPQQVAQLRHREAEAAQQEARLAQHDAQLAQREAELAQLQAELREHDGELAQWESELRQQEAEFDQQEAELSQREAELAEREAELHRQETQLHQRLDQRETVAALVGAEAATSQISRPFRHAQQLRAVPKPVAVNGSAAPHLEEVRPVVSVHGRHDMERMEIRAVADTLGTTITETLRERTRNHVQDKAEADEHSDPPTELERLKAENAELQRSLGLLKSAAALLAAALDGA
jgi:DivIVA domain-containing protein